MKKQTVLLACILLLMAVGTSMANTICSTPPSGTVPTVWFDPQDSFIATLPGTATVDVCISAGTGGVLGGYDLFINWDPTVVGTTAGDITFHATDFFQTSNLINGQAEFLALSDDIVNGYSGNMDVATIVFTGLQDDSMTYLTWNTSVLTSVSGDDITSNANFQRGSITIGTPAGPPVPEPGTMVLLGSGLAAAATRLRRRK